MGTLQPTAGQSLVDRFVGVLKLDTPTYEEIKRDVAANGQAWLIVLLTGLLSGIGSVASMQQSLRQLRDLPATNPELAQSLPPDLPTTLTPGSRIALVLLSIVFAVIGWYIMSALLGWVGRQFFGGDPATTGDQMRRLVAWSYAPLMFMALGGIPVIGDIVTFVASIWALATMFRAIKVGLNLSTGKSVGTWFVAGILPGLVMILIVCLVLGVVVPMVPATP